MARCLAAVLALLAFTSPASAGVCRYENMMPAFLTFERQTKDLAPAQRANLFANQFALQYRDFYGELGQVEGDKGFPPAARLRQEALGLLDPAHMESLPGFAPLTQARFEAIAQATGPDFEQAQSAFLRAFPDFHCQVAIAFGPSFLHFDGHAYEDKSGRHLLFGVDAIALEHGPAELPVFYEHELFHVYHGEVLGKVYPKDDKGLWWVMWEEGLASYVSQRLNPAVSPQQVFWFPADLVARMQMPGATQRAARLMLADFDKSGETYWFDSGHSAPGNLPPRAGYYMGYELAASLGRDHSLAWLAHLPPESVKLEACKFLEGRGSLRL
jgi:hypothetical protein